MIRGRPVILQTIDLAVVLPFLGILQIQGAPLRDVSQRRVAWNVDARVEQIGRRHVDNIVANIVGRHHPLSSDRSLDA